MKITLLTIALFALAGLSPAIAEVPAEMELYLLVGQSNMAGRGKILPEDRQADPKVFVLDRNNEWVSQGEPIHFDKADAGVGLGFTFAKLMAAKKPGVTIGLIPCAVGGTPISRWMPGGDLYEKAIVRARIALKHGKLNGILWHQGESECSKEELAAAYGRKLAAVATGFRKDLRAPDVPFVAGELGEYLYTRSSGKSPYARVVNEQIDSLPTLISNAVVVPSHGLGHGGDELHFSAEALKEFGARYVKALESLDGPKKATDAKEASKDVTNK